MYMIRDKKGQSLVLFVMLLPMILMIFFMVVDIGKMVLLKLELSNINKIAIDYALDDMANELVIDNTKKLINKNKNDIDRVDVSIKNDKIYVTLEDNTNLLVFKNVLEITTSYVGYVEDDKRIIERKK